MRLSLKSLLARSKCPRASLAVLTCATLSVVACDTWGPRVYTAQAYQPDDGCLGGYEPVGLVEADELGASCEPVCLRLGDTLYLSTVCPPYPSEAGLEDAEASPDCAAALGLLEAEAACDDESAAPDASADAAE